MFRQPSPASRRPRRTTTTTTSSCSFTKDLTIGSSGSEVTCLQQALIAGGYKIAAGATGYFGAQSQAAVIAWQKAAGVTPAAGYFGAKSRSAFNLGGGSTTTTTGGGTTNAGTGNGLKVTLSPTSPNGSVLVQGQAIGDLGDFIFANPTASPINVTSLTFHRTGVSNDATMVNVYIYNGAQRLTDAGGVSSGVFSFNDPTGIFTVPAGQTVTISVRADILSTASGQQIGASLVSVSSSGTLDSSVSFPINSGYQTVSAATLATVDYAGTTYPSSSSVSPQTDYTVWQNTVTIGTRAVSLKSFQLQNIGSIGSGDITNLRLYVDGVQAGTASSLKNNIVTWDLSAAPVRLETGGRVIKVVGDIVGGSSLTFKFSLRRASDAQMIDVDLNQPVLATAAGSTFTARTATSATIASGTVSVTKATSSPSSNISLGATNVKFATFEMRAAGEDIKVDNIDVKATSAGNTARGLDNGKVYLNGVQVGSTKDLTDATSVNFTFGSSFILKAGTTAIVDIYADAKSTTGAAYVDGNTVQVLLPTQSGNGNGQGMVSLSSIDVPGSQVAGNSITITSSSMTVAKYSGYANQTMIAGTSNAKLGAFTLSTGSTEGVNVNTITVTLSDAEAATITDLKLVNDATGAQIGTTKPTPSGTNSFSVNLTIPASGTVVIDLIGNIKSGANAGTWAANIDGSGTGSTTGTAVTFGSASASTATLQTITLSSAVLTAAVGVSPDNANVIAGSSLVKVGSFNFTSQYSDFTVDKIAVKIPNIAATSVASVTLKGNGLPTDGATAYLASPTTSQNYATATFTGLTFLIPQNTTKTLDVYVNLNGIQADADSGKGVSVVLDYNEGFRSTDSSGTTSTTLAVADLSSASTGKGTMYIRKSIPTLSAVALDSSTLITGSNKVIGRVKVTADAAGDVSWDKIVFTVSKTAAITLGATTTIQLYDGLNAISGNFSTTTGDQQTQTQMFTTAATSGYIVFEPTAEQTVSAGTPKTYDLRTTIGGSLTSGQYLLDISVANPNSTSITTNDESTVAGASGSTGVSFVWSDRSSIATVHSTTTTDWTNDYLIKTLPLTVGTQTVNI